MDIFKEVKELKLPLGKYVVVGSGPMAARGIRDYKDIDILATQNLYDELINQKWKIVKINGVNGEFKTLKNGKFEVDKKLCCGNYNPDTESLIKNAEIINGIPFMPLKELIKFKTALSREKDFKDIILIEEYLAKKDGVQKIVAAAVIKIENKFLLLERVASDFMGGLVELPSGGVNGREKILDALTREVKEETGLTVVKIVSYLGFFDYDSSSDKKTRQFNFFVKTIPGDVIIDPREHLKYYWLNPKDKEFVRLNISEGTKNILRNVSN